MDSFIAGTTTVAPHHHREKIVEEQARLDHVTNTYEAGKVRYDEATADYPAKIGEANAAVAEAVKAIVVENAVRLGEQREAAKRDLALAEAALLGLMDFAIATKDVATHGIIDDIFRGIYPGQRRTRTITSGPQLVSVRRTYIAPEAMEAKLKVHPNALENARTNVFKTYEDARGIERAAAIEETTMVEQRHTATIDLTFEDLQLKREKLKEETAAMRKHYANLPQQLTAGPQ